MLVDKWQRLTLNLRIYKYLRMLLDEAKLTKTQIQSIQFKRLKSLLCEAYQTHPFYRERFDSCGLDPFKMSGFEEFKKLPLLTREEYREFVDRYSDNHPDRCNGLYRDRTSGSTGNPLTIYRTWDERAYMCAKWMRALKLNGYSHKDITFSLPSPQRLQRDSIVQQFGLFKRYSVSYTAPVEEMVKGYLKCNPTVLYANKSQLVMMALYCLKNNITLSKPELCVSAAETMEDSSRLLITKVFGDDNFIEVYGAVEFNNIAWQEKGNDFFWISHTTNYFELEEDSDSDCRRSIITDLFIRSFPLIRYDLGDKIETGIQNGQTVIKKILGRSDDWIVFSDGGRLPNHAFSKIMLRRPEILQYRVIQENYELIRILAVTREGTDEIGLSNILMHDLRNGVRDAGMNYKFEWVKEIPPDPNGKIRMLISRVEQNV